jgi:hypothetical protein
LDDAGMQHRVPWVDVANGLSRRLGQRLRDILEVQRNARNAETAYFRLSRLSDAELGRQGISRKHILRRVFACLTGTRAR